MIKIFLDTNIIIDVMEKREPYFLQSANLLELGYKGYVSLYATSLTFINALYISRKSIGKEAAIEKVKLLRNFIEISPMSAQEFDIALRMDTKDIEDNLQYSSALSAECNIIVTRNKKDFPANASVKILTPQEFFDYYAKLLQQQ